MIVLALAGQGLAPAQPKKRIGASPSASAAETASQRLRPRDSYCVDNLAASTACIRLATHPGPDSRQLPVL